MGLGSNDLDREDEASGLTQLTGIGELHKADVTPNKELTISDTHDHGGLDTILTITSGTPIELKVGGTRLANRKYVIIEALGTGIKWGFSSRTQSFDIFKSQILMVPIGQNTQIWFDCDAATKDVAVGELA